MPGPDECLDQPPPPAAALAFLIPRFCRNQKAKERQCLHVFLREIHAIKAAARAFVARFAGSMLAGIAGTDHRIRPHRPVLAASQSQVIEHQPMTSLISLPHSFK